MEHYGKDPLEHRFEFKESGAFFIRTKHTALYTIIIVCTAIIAAFSFPAFLIWLTGVGPQHERFSYFILFYALTAGIFTVILIILSAIAIGLIHKGSKCRYVADEKSLKLFIPHKPTVEYRYENAKNVYFVPITGAGKTVGFEITVMTKQGVDKYQYISPRKGAFTTPENTPFYYLQAPPVSDETRSDKDIGIVF